MLPVWLTDTITSDLDRALHYTLLWGLEGVVLRTVGGTEDRVPHVNEARLKARLREHELPAVAVDPGLLEQAASARIAWMNDLTLLDEVVAFCSRVGCSRILVGGVPGDDALAGEALRRAGERAARKGCVVAVRNEVEGRATAQALAAAIEAADHPAVGACWSPADALEAGEDPATGLQALGDTVSMVIVRDGTMRVGRWEPKPVGEGAVGWASLLRSLHERGYDGPLCLDLSGVEEANDGLRDATAMIRTARSARRG